MNMEQWARVRRKVLVDKQSKRSVMSEEGLHWETLQKMLEHSQPPGYRRSSQPERKIDPFRARLYTRHLNKCTVTIIGRANDTVIPQHRDTNEWTAPNPR